MSHTRPLQLGLRPFFLPFLLRQTSLNQFSSSDFFSGYQLMGDFDCCWFSIPYSSVGSFMAEFRLIIYLGHLPAFHQSISVFSRYKWKKGNSASRSKSRYTAPLINGILDWPSEGLPALQINLGLMKAVRGQEGSRVDSWVGWLQKPASTVSKSLK